MSGRSLQVQSGPHLYSSSGSNWSVVVADRTVILFDQTYQSILLHLDFGKLAPDVPCVICMWVFMCR